VTTALAGAAVALAIFGGFLALDRAMLNWYASSTANLAEEVTALTKELPDLAVAAAVSETMVSTMGALAIAGEAGYPLPPV
jgi:hypothetical protein